MPEFNLASRPWPAAIQLAIDNHERGLPQLMTWRSAFAYRPIAEGLADFLIGDYPEFGTWGISLARADLINVFANPSGAYPQYQGNRTVFDPWNGWWGGNWVGAGSSRPLPQYHVWDETQPVAAGSTTRSIQPVTQSVHGFVHSGNLDACWTGNCVDVGLNAWAPGVGITGWVEKRQYGPETLPHVGYSLDARTLVWITQRNWVGPYWMFLENASGSSYRIAGRTFQVVAVRTSATNPRGQAVGRGGPLGIASYTTRAVDRSFRSPAGGCVPPR